MKLGPKNVFSVFWLYLKKKNFFFFPFVFKLLYGGASRKKKIKKKFENRFSQIARFLGGVPLKLCSRDLVSNDF
jgi:hypothetical protein